ncbi:golgin subfamily A member 6-like protein 22 isoform X2 [Belonocnema kinseyi]|uniref:golgin subfamily A member 6-like protein 22 isoform X2 n=1 Tax=Belonocnema kinseyi TaxID=2817044 RepID=UPI00143D5A3C|nr:golgin subfamily A member 6-like protein 22 isoform X2 [Belonocnema kinseyi]
MRRKYQLSYFFLYVLIPFFQVQLSSTFPKNIDFNSSLKGQVGENPYSEILSERQDERRNNNPNLIRKKRYLGSLNEITEKRQIQPENLNKNPYERRKRNVANNGDKSLKDNIEKEDTEEDDTEEEDTEENKNERENLKRSKRQSDQNPNVTKNLIEREADYAESIKDDDFNIQEQESEEDESESRNENRVKRNEERDYEKKLKSKADINNAEKLSEKEESRKESLHEKRHLEPNSKNKKVQSKHEENSGDSSEEVNNSEIVLRLDSDQKLISSQNSEYDEKLTSNLSSKFDHRKELKADKKSYKKEDAELNGYLDLEVKEDESDDEYEKRVAEQIQQKIDAIKEEIKREIEEKQKIETIKENNDRYDELRQEEEDESQTQILDANNQIVSKRCLEKVDFNSEKLKQQIEKRRRSKSGNEKVQLHESIRKRSAPKYGGVEVYQDKKEENTETPRLELDSASSDDGKVRLKRSNSRVFRRVDKRRAKNLVPKRRLGNLRYRPQNIEDDNDEEGSEFEDDGFNDHSSNLDEANLNSRIEIDNLSNAPGNPLFDHRNYLMRRKRERDSRVSKRKRHQRKRRRKNCFISNKKGRIFLENIKNEIDVRSRELKSRGKKPDWL